MTAKNIMLVHELKRRQAVGFTLIELMAVIAILGLLSATAVPKFIDVSYAARLSVLKGIAAALSSGSSVNYTQDITYAAGLTVIAPVTVDTCDDAANFLAEGLPDGYYLPASLGTGQATTISGGGVAVDGGISLCKIAYDSNGDGNYDNSDRPITRFILHGVQ